MAMTKSLELRQAIRAPASVRVSFVSSLDCSLDGKEKMTSQNRFVIENDQATALIVVAEPEACELRLAKDENVLVTDNFNEAPVTIRVTTSQAGEPVLSIWPGDGNVKIEKDGIDILEIAQRTPNARSA